MYLDAEFGWEEYSSPALDQALKAFNDIHSSIFFSRTYDRSQANIIISDSYLLTHVAESGPPSSTGRPFGSIKVDVTLMRDYNKLTLGNFLFIFAHELGHTIGLMHTNSTDGSFISGTDPNDTKSIMRNDGSGSWGLGFTENDKKAILTLYPPDVKCGFDLGRSNDNIFASDYDGNGIAELFFYRPGAKAVMFNQSQGNGTFSTIFQSGLGLGDFDFNELSDRAISLDYNGDGKDDVLCYRPGKKTVYLLKSNGDKTYTTVYASTNGIGGYDFNLSIDRAIALDYDGDGKDDILCYRPGYRVVYLLKSNGNGSFTPIYANYGFAGYSFGNSADVAISLDYNGDGLDDLLCSRAGSKIVYLLKSNGDGTYVTVYASSKGIGGYSFGNSADVAISLDYNGDGFDDLLCSRPGSKIVYLLKSNGDGTFVTVYASGNGIASFDFALSQDKAVSLDYNHDGLSDIVLYRPGYGVAWAAHSDGTSFILDSAQ